MANSKITTTKPCYFWKPPQEVLDMIFELAYGNLSPSTLTDRTTWEVIEERRRRWKGHKYVPRPFGPYKIDEFMVSKLYFLGAARAWYGTRIWDLYSTCACRRNDLLHQFATAGTPTLFAGQFGFRGTEHLARLQVFHIELRTNPLEQDTKFARLDSSKAV